MSLLFSLGHPQPICLPWASLGLLSLLALLWACRGPFLLFSHHTLPMGLLFAISLFPGSFEPICFLKTHLFISWTCDPLFLPLGLNGFCSLSFANFFSVCVAGLGFLPFIRVPQKKTLNNYHIVSLFFFKHLNNYNWRYVYICFVSVACFKFYLTFGMLCCLVILVREISIIFNGSYVVCVCFHNMCDSRILFSLILNFPHIVFYNMLMWTSE